MKYLQRMLAHFRSFPKFARDVAALVLLAAVLLPHSFMEVAAKVGYEMHVVSFILGPATYTFGNELVPGRDYFTQYSLGLPFVFSWVLDGSADHAVLSYVKLMITTMLVFYGGLYFLLCWLFQSRGWALAVSFTILILQFHVDRTFFDPSSYVLRYPLLVLTLALMGVWAKNIENVRWAVALSFTLALSLFLNTETGLYQCIAVTVTGFFLARGRFEQLVVLAGVILSNLAIYVALCWLAFGDGVFSLAFFEGWFEPFSIYGGGFGGWAIDWAWGWHILYNILAPGLAITTAAWGAHRLWNSSPTNKRRPQIAVLVGFGLMGVLMSAKYSNMSIVALWHVNAICFLVVVGWWARQTQLAVHDKVIKLHLLQPPLQIQADKGVAVLTALLALAILITTNDERNPNLYAFKAWIRYPSLANPLASRFAAGCKTLECSALRIHAEDVLLIKKYVPEGQRAAVLGWNDWAYLIEARRASWFQFLPSYATFTRRQLNAAAHPPDVVFIEKGKPGDPMVGHPELGQLIGKQLERDYLQIDQSYNLLALKRGSVK